jgi:hypothetical protein
MSKDFIATSKRPTPAAVRAWGAEQNAKGANLPGTTPGTRGRLNPALVKAFNAKHKGQNAYAEGEAVKTVTVTVKPDKGRSKTVRLNVAEARKAALAAGHSVGKRGNLPEAVVKALVLS